MNHRKRHFTIGIFLLAGCLASTAGSGAGPLGGVTMPLELKSPDFISGGIIPKQFTCDGADISPALEWNDPPGATQSFALITDDPDAPVGTSVHWVLFDLPSNARTLPQNVPKKEHRTAIAESPDDFVGESKVSGVELGIAGSGRLS